MKPDDIRQDVLHNKTDTSIEAATRIASSRGRISKMIESRLRENWAGLTCEEIAATLKMKVQTVSARLVELHEAKHIAPRRDEFGQVMRRPTIAGKTAIVWKRGFVAGDIEHKRRPKRKTPARVPKNLGPKTIRVMRFALDREDRGFTCRDVESILQIRHQSAAPIVSQLKTLGIVVDTRNRRGGSIVWRITPVGRDRLVNETRKAARGASPTPAMQDPHAGTGDEGIIR